MVNGSLRPLGAYVRGSSAWIVWQTARDSLSSRLRQLESDPHVHRDVVRHLRGTLADLELAAIAYRDWERARSVADSVEVTRGGSSAGLENLPGWGDTSEVAASLGCSKRWVTALIQQGKLAATKRGRAWFIDLDSVEDFKRRGAVAA
jgi:excisionase family DNA binding protein